jgi:phosphoglycolate phosphatase
MCKKFEHIIWDWNGTLLDDAQICVDAMNQSLKERNMPLTTLESYRNLFCFPVINYYKLLGFDFDKESFETLSIEFMSKYNELSKNAKLIENAKQVLDSYKTKGIKQYSLSASQINNLKIQLDFYKLTDYFDDIIGLDHIYATSKIEAGKNWLSKIGIPPEKIIMFGDTIHDYETAVELGCDIALIANGHQTKERLMKTDAPVLNSIPETERFFLTTYKTTT